MNRWLMRRFLLLLRNEFKLTRSAIPMHLVALLQPTVMYLLMSTILVRPTFDLYVTRPERADGQTLVAAMQQVGSPIGEPYINPILIDSDNPEGLRQVVTVEEQEEQVVAVQRYGLIDSNIVKNFRNRLTAAVLRVWQDDLGERAVRVTEKPWLPRDMPYALYFGMAMLPMTTALAASLIGGSLTSQEFESGTVLEYRLTPLPAGWVIAVRLCRLILFGLLSAALLLVSIGCVTGIWPARAWMLPLILIPVAVSMGGLGMTAGLTLRRSIPAFLVGLVTTFVSWLVGSAFGLAAGFNRVYEAFSRLTPNTHAVELLFPLFYKAGVGNPLGSILFLTGVSLVSIAITTWAYRRAVTRQI